MDVKEVFLIDVVGLFVLSLSVCQLVRQLAESVDQSVGQSVNLISLSVF